MLTFRPDDIPIIDREWIIRNDGSYLVIYKLSTSESWNFVLTPILGTFVSLINGKTKLSELYEKVGYVFSINDPEEVKKFVGTAIHIINKDATIISLRGEDNNDNIFETADYFIPLNHYSLPKKSRLTLPTHFRIITSNKCQTNCIYCYADLSTRGAPDLLSYDEWEKIIDYCIQNKILNIEIGGGDPIADDLSIKVIEYLLQSNIPVFISTKAVLTKDTINTFINAGFLKKFRGINNLIQISVDAVSKDLADTLTSSKNYVLRADQNVKMCLEYGIEIKIKSVLTRLNYLEIVPLLKKYADMGVKNFQFVTYGRSYFRPREDLLLGKKEKSYIHYVNENIIKEKYSDLKIIVQDDPNNDAPTRMSQADWEKRARCTGGYSSMTVIPNGKVILCEQLPQNDFYFVGDIRENTITNIWQSKKLEEWLLPPRDKFLGTICYSCAMFYDCIHNAGWCYRDTLFAYATIFEACPRCPKQTKIGNKLQ